MLGDSLELTNSFAGGVVTSGGTEVGRLVGEETNGGAGLVDSEFNENISCTTCTHAKGSSIDVGGGAPANYFYDKSSNIYSSNDKWDFDNIWKENTGNFPTFR